MDDPLAPATSRPKVGQVVKACAVLSWLAEVSADDDDRYEVARVRQRLIDHYEGILPEEAL